MTLRNGTLQAGPEHRGGPLPFSLWSLQSV
jgi:hypothetical protein